MPQQNYETVLAAVNQDASPLMELHKQESWEAVFQLCHNKRLVLLGQSSTGSQEFCELRSAITQQLIKNQGFNALVLEGDWPDIYQLNLYIQGHLPQDSLPQILKQFKKFPAWLTCNTVMYDFLIWLRAYNDAKPRGQSKIGCYALDLFNLQASVEKVIQYLEEHDAAAALEARHRYACFECARHDGRHSQTSEHYAFPFTYTQEVTELLLKLEIEAFNKVLNNSKTRADKFFYNLQYERFLKSGPSYYQALFNGAFSSWNVRDYHMAATVTALKLHLQKRLKKRPKIIVWAHNSHVGDARATEMAAYGELNFGQLLKEQHGQEVLSIGFSTYSGQITAAGAWGAEPEKKHLSLALAGSFEALFHQARWPLFLLPLSSTRFGELNPLSEPRLQRAIGVIYSQEDERHNHYYYSRLAQQFNAIVHVDKTHALMPYDMDFAPNKKFKKTAQKANSAQVTELY